MLISVPYVLNSKLKSEFPGWSPSFENYPKVFANKPISILQSVFFDSGRKSANLGKKVVRWFWEFSICKISENVQKSKIFKLSHIGEFLSYEAPMGLIFSEIGHTLRLEQNKIPFSILKMIKNIKHPAAKRIKKTFFPYLEKNAPLVKVLPINQKPLKMILFSKNLF